MTRYSLRATTLLAALFISAGVAAQQPPGGARRPGACTKCRRLPGLGRRVRHRRPPYVIDMTYADEHQERGRVAGMSTARRRLGTGPMSTRTTAEEERAPRLLAAERVDPGQLLADAGHRETADRNGRRVLGPRGSSVLGEQESGAVAGNAGA